MATYRPFHLLDCPARDGRVKVGRCVCPLWRFLDPGSAEPEEGGEAEAGESLATPP